MRSAFFVVVCASSFAFVHTPAIRVACIGDSITQGWNQPPADWSTKSYPAVLGTKLGSHYVVHNYGVSGATLLKNGNNPYWNQNQFAASSAWLPDIVIIQLGTNDAKSANMSHYGDFLADYIDLIHHYQNLPSHPKVFVNLPPAMYDNLTSSSYPKDSRLVSDLLPKILAAASQTHAAVIDVHSATTGKQTLFPDGVHPNAVGAALIAETVYGAVTAMARIEPRKTSMMP